MNDSIDILLNERSKYYGNYRGGCQTRINIMNAILDRHKQMTGRVMPKMYQEYIYDIVNKLSRIAVTPNHLDSWNDIVGYAKLIIQEIQKEEKNHAYQQQPTRHKEPSSK